MLHFIPDSSKFLSEEAILQLLDDSGFNKDDADIDSDYIPSSESESETEE